MNFRLVHYLKQKLVCVFIFCLFILCAVYFYTTRVQVPYTTEHWSGGRCFSELTSLKYQLNGKNGVNGLCIKMFMFIKMFLFIIKCKKLITIIMVGKNISMECCPCPATKRILP